jgi:hypothetical protein
MTNFMNGISSIFGALGNTAKTPAKTGAQLSSAELREYNRQAKAIVEEYDTDGNNYLSAAEAKKVPLFKGQDLSTTMFDKLFTSLAQRGMSQVELSRTLQLMDADRDGEVAKEERNSFVEEFTAELKNGANPNALYATLSANALRHGGAKSTGDELRNLKALFEKYDIDKTDYTPDKETTDDPENGADNGLGDLIEAGLPLLQRLIGNKTDTTTSDTNTADTNRDQAKALKLRQEIARLQASQALPSLSSPLASLPPSSFASQLPPPLSSPLGLLPELPPDQRSLLGLPLPLAAGNNISPTLMPAQATFAQPVAQQQPFTFAQPAPTVATAPASTAWTAPAPVAQDQVPASGWNPLPTTPAQVAPNLVAQAPQFNGGW